MCTLDDVDDEFDVSAVIEKMKMHVKKVQEEAAEAKKANDLILQKTIERVIKAEKELERVKAMPSPLEKLGWSKKSNKYTKARDMTPAYLVYLRRPVGTTTSCPDLEELD
jgi:hypothetical protein